MESQTKFQACIQNKQQPEQMRTTAGYTLETMSSYSGIVAETWQKQSIVHMLKISISNSIMLLVILPWHTCHIQ